MIPFFQLPTIMLGPIPIQVWGTMVALGFLLGGFASAKMAKRRGLEHKHIYDMAGWIVLSAIIFARLGHVLFYEPAYFLANPAEIIAFWQGGMSMYGGFIGALIAGIVYMKKNHLDVWKYSDAAIFGLPLGIFIGRIGCFLIHDHPGTATDFFLGVKYPDGVTRHDLGLYESIGGLLLFIVFLILAKKQVEEKTYLIVFCAWYGVTRFLMDFLRVADVHYGGLTPAQYLSLVLIGTGVYIWWKHSKKR